MPLQATSGTASYDAFGGGAAVEPVYIEQTFQTYLYTGNGSTQTITNGIDLSGKGGLVWIKGRSSESYHRLSYANNTFLNSGTSDGATSISNTVAFNSSGFSLGSNSAAYNMNDSGLTLASWTFRKQPKFFDVVTWTGNAANRTIAHSLGSVPGCIIVKRTDSTGYWSVYHRGLGDTPGLNPEKFVLYLQTTNAQDGYVDYWNMTLPTSTQFSIGANSVVNANGGTYVAYVFAHNAGGFGLTGTDNVISCGSYVGGGSVTVNLGYEPQWVLLKDSTSPDNWELIDTMRGWPIDGTDNNLRPNLSNAESTRSLGYLTSTGFVAQLGASTPDSTFIYIAIRRGPMKVPTSGTSVFSPNTNLTNTQYTVGFPNDWAIEKRPAGTTNWRAGTRLTGNDAYLDPNSTAAEVANTTWVFNGPTNTFTQLRDATGALVYSFKRAPSYFDVVCYTGTGSARTVAHNLGVAPELMIVKSRGTVNNWIVYCSLLNTPAQNRLVLNGNFGQLTTPNATWWNSTNPTSSVFSLSGDTGVNGSGQTQVAYLFATCAGVSKVGSYTGNGSSQTINCGFTSGARFVLIKATSAAGHWRVYDTARGIVAGNEPELFLNLTDAEQTVYDAIDTASSGFIVNSNGANVNDSGVTYIFLAIA